eukprot:CAMPEP_0185585036 /NCGR_PEP_ID=MMETSP0434-20130131/36018_1 /TAXON_ID=626734 ORGANISM="Favella taraikaensis, Strain Fe Narragansett Bay" /NCGR_SAMPLE_ID=MMETSP0434 /ASSEMBLY_ACC=CAM_ASM_000379 /LENGTH=86 /DNA_ID=CAMNT_0028205133 /DNA_START=29 /DNA_END=289 /DNA_ORIENTATION=+
MIAGYGSASPRTNSQSPARSSASPVGRLPESNFFGGTFQRQSYENSPNSGIPMMQTKENAYKLRAIMSQQRVNGSAATAGGDNNAH